MQLKPLKIREHQFLWGDRTYIMGILNVTPDSFSDGGEFASVDAAVAQAIAMTEAGADIIDVGGESTRPGAESVAVETELDRTVAVIRRIRQQSNVPISIDTTKAAVAEAATAAGADLVNDVSGATYDPEMLSTVARLDVPIVLMHLRGTPKTMQQLTDYQDVIGEVYQFLAQRIEAATAAGVGRTQILIDPGIGFAKTYQQSIELIRNLERFRKLEAPILVGTSRKSFIGRILGKNNPKEKIWGTAASCCAAIAGGADLLRVHDVAQMYDVCRVADAIWRNQNS